MLWKNPWTKGLVVAVGAVVVAPVLLPAVAALLRPLAKMVIAGALEVSEAVAGIWPQATQPQEKEAAASPAATVGASLISEATGAAVTPLAEEVMEAAAEVLETLA